MFKNNAFSKISASRLGIMILTASFLLVIAACGGTAANSPSPTQASAGNIPPVQQSIDVPTQVPPSSSTVAASVKDICSLVTQADVEAVLGEPVTTITPSSKPVKYLENVFNQNTCIYSGSKSTYVSITSVDQGPEDYFLSAREANQKICSPLEDEPGLGDNAFWCVRKDAVVYSVYKAIHGFIFVVLQGITSDSASHRASLLTLTKSVLTVLPTSTSPVTAKVQDICSLVAKAEVEAVMGQSVASTSANSAPDSISEITNSFCTYSDEPPAGSPYPDKSVDISSRDAGSVQVAGEILNKQLDQKRNKGATVTQIKGLGDDAYWIVEEGLVSYIAVKDTHVFSVNYFGFDAKTKQALLLKLAESVSTTQ
jgi:hypothetical protein